VPIIDRWDGDTAWLRRDAPCPECEGGRLKRPQLFVTLGPGRSARRAEDGAPLPGMSIADVCALTVKQSRAFWEGLALEATEAMIAEQVLRELQSRLTFLDDVGLSYLQLERAADTLSGGESQRIRLATQLGSHLTGTIYVLDEPTIGLHPRDTQRLLGTLRGLVDLGNTLVVVEHDPEVMRAADMIVDMGPGAGEHGGRIVAQGPPEALPGGVTADFLSGRRSIPVPAQRRVPKAWLEAPAITQHNLHNVSVRLPRGCLTVLTGVSGSGKSTLLMDAFAPWLEQQIDQAKKARRRGLPERLVIVDQKPIGKSRAPARPATPSCSIPSASSTPSSPTPASRAGRPASSPSTPRRAAARTARAAAPSWWRCTSSAMSGSRVSSAGAAATRIGSWRRAGRASRSPTCWTCRPRRPSPCSRTNVPSTAASPPSAMSAWATCDWASPATPSPAARASA
jgi:energy-coupling factor transporter ATP-binding protein EcfA2